MEKSSGWIEELYIQLMCKDTSLYTLPHFSAPVQPQRSPMRGKEMFPYLEASVTAFPLQDAVHTSLAWLHRPWKIG